MHSVSILLFAALTFISVVKLLVTCSPTNYFPHLGPAPQYEISKQNGLLKRDQKVPTSLYTTFQPLRRRSLVADLGEGWEIFLTHSENFLPISDATEDLGKFYRRTLDEVRGYVLTNHEQYNTFAFRSGNLAMTWQCDMSDIPWKLVHTVASQLLQATYRGFATQFSMQFRHTHGIVIEVVLQVLPAAVQALLDSP